MLAAHPGLSGLFAARAGIAEGVARALRERENRGVKAVGLDLTDALAAECLAGWIDSLVAPDWFHYGLAAARAIVRAGKPARIEPVYRLFVREDLQ